jgi:hypothetical protein
MVSSFSFQFFEKHLNPEDQGIETRELNQVHNPVITVSHRNLKERYKL